MGEIIDTSANRLKELLGYLKLSANKLSVELGLSANTKIYHVKNGRNEFSSELSKLISDKYPEVSYVWLLDGKGEMLKQKSGYLDDRLEEIVKENQASFSTCQNCDSKVKEIELLKSRIKDKEELIVELRTRLAIYEGPNKQTGTG